MLARSTRLTHPSGVSLQTPLLVPSFSSKVFQFQGDQCPELMDTLILTQDKLTDSLLVSAYDLHFNYLEIPDECSPEIIFVDSGGYESMEEFDPNLIYQRPFPKEEWERPQLENELNGWPDYLPAVFVNYDNPTIPLREQIEQARSFFELYPKQLHDFLMKPERDEQNHESLFISPESVSEHITELKSFHIIGVTEKELGNSVLSRMRVIRKLRIALDEGNITAPIHVFGGLDPLTSCLYFVAGAEIFDSLTWLRYYYRHGLALYNLHYSALDSAIDVNFETNIVTCRRKNLDYLTNLRYEMRSFLQEGDFKVFTYHSDLIREASEKL